jgi:CRISPR system Cascade subunit CasA
MLNTCVPKFNLLDEPWIPVLNQDDIKEQVSLIQLLLNAREYKQIDCELASQSYALLRVALAYLYSSLPFTEDDWVDYWNNGFPDEKIKSYAEHWHDRFYLFHPEYPFMQTPNMRLKDDRVMPVNKMMPDVGTGNAVFYTKTDSTVEKLDYDDAALCMIASMWCDPCGGHTSAIGDPREGKTTASKGRVYPTAASMTSMTIIVPNGKSLLETLLLCLPATDSSYLQQFHPDRVVGGENDRPVWELPPQQVGGSDKNHRITPAGVISMLTFPSRRLLLFEDGERVTGCIVTDGDSLSLANGMDYEQMCSWAWGEKKLDNIQHSGLFEFHPVHRSQTRALWRGMSSLLADEDSKKERMSTVIEWARNISRDELVPSDYVFKISALTVRTDVPQNSAISDIIEDTIPLPSLVLDNKQLSRYAVEAVSLAETAAKSYRNYVTEVAYASGNDKNLSIIVNNQYGVYYSHMEPLYYQWLKNLSSDDDPMSTWRDILTTNTLGLAKDYSRLAPSSAIVGIVNNKGKIRSIATGDMKLRKELKSL